MEDGQLKWFYYLLIIVQIFGPYKILVFLEEFQKIIKNKKAIYNLNVDKSSNKFEHGNQLQKFEINKLPTYIQINKDNLKEWID